MNCWAKSRLSGCTFLPAPCPCDHKEQKPESWKLSRLWQHGDWLGKGWMQKAHCQGCLLSYHTSLLNYKPLSHCVNKKCTFDYFLCCHKKAKHPISPQRLFLNTRQSTRNTDHNTPVAPNHVLLRNTQLSQGIVTDTPRP